MNTRSLWILIICAIAVMLIGPIVKEILAIAIAVAPYALGVFVIGGLIWGFTGGNYKRR